MGVVALSVLQPMYFPRGLKNFLTDMVVSISKPKRAYALRMSASGYLHPYISFSSPPSHGIMGSGSVHINSPTSEVTGGIGQSSAKNCASSCVPGPDSCPFTSLT